ncbi:MAG: oligosaccharide flippase family protein [Haliea sp.]
MSESRTSYKEILRSTFIMGGASFLKILIGVIRIKILAVVLGPSGVGLIGVLTSTMTMGASVAGMGLNSSGVRQIAASTDDEEKLPYVRRALWYANLFLGIVGGAIFWIFRNPISEVLFNSTGNATLVALLGIGVFLSVLCGAQYALLQGMRRIGHLARATIISSVISAIVGVGAVVLWREQGIIVFVLIGPLATIAIGSYYAAKLPRPGHMVFSLKKIYHVWRGMFLL